MNLKNEHTSRLWTFIMKGEIMAFELDDDEMIATRINNKAASWKEVEEYIEKYYVRKDKIKEKLLNPIQKEGKKVYKSFMNKNKKENFEVDGAILQELGCIEGIILEELLGE